MPDRNFGDFEFDRNFGDFELGRSFGDFELGQNLSAFELGQNLGDFELGNFTQFNFFLVHAKPENDGRDIPELFRSFWEEYKPLFPRISKIAAVILNASPSCSTIERFFSELASMLTPERNRMTAKTIFARAATRHAVPIHDALENLDIS